MDGADASTTFTDDSAAAHAVTVYGNAQIDTAYQKFGSGAGLLDGTGDYLTVGDHADFDLSGGVWTIDFWMRATGAGIIYYHQTDANNMFYVSLEATERIFLTIASAGSAVVLVGSTALDYNTWYHIAIVENGNNYYVFVNGSLSGSLTDTDRPADYTGASVYIGSNATPGSYFTGHLDEFRISKGVARWTSAFTPSAAAYNKVS